MDQVNQIHWLKKPMVDQCVRIAEEEKNVRRMIIFGSSVTEKCREDSDVDICVDMRSGQTSPETYRTLMRMTKACGLNCDIVFYGDIKGRLKDEIEQNGVTVYVS
ncbi:MAG: nucleotidyltransferase domain-containing protein [Clostridia bacterium]|nr:nucleotidyltransferase domain-containing protein [Clostridia bacterium]